MSTIICIAENQNITIECSHVMFPDGSTIPIISGQTLRYKLIELFNQVKAPAIVWEKTAHIIGFDVAQFMHYRQMPWRVGRTIGRTIYHNDVCMGMMDTPEVAAQVVAALNAKEK